MGDLDKLIVAKGFEKLPEFQRIAQSGHIAHETLSSAPVKRLVYVTSPTCPY